MREASMKHTIGWIIPIFIAAIAAWAVSDWIYEYHTYSVEPRVAGLDGRPEIIDAPYEEVDLTGTLETFDGTPSAITASWPGFRGANRDGILEDDAVTLAEQWPAGGPPELWRVEMGEGYAGARCIRGGYVIDYDSKPADAIRCHRWMTVANLAVFYPVLVRHAPRDEPNGAGVNGYVVTIGQVSCGVSGCKDGRIQVDH